MGILSGKDIYSPKWTTADIVDSAGMVHYVPIKYTIGDYFLADIEGQVYAFKVLGERIKTWRKSMAKSFRKIYYDTSHYLPIDAAKTKELGDILRKNNLPRVDGNLFTVLKLVGHKEKEGKDFEPVDLMKMVEELSGEEGKYSEAVQNIRNYLTHLSTEEIVTPVQKITEFIEDDIMATDARFMGSIMVQARGTDKELRKVTNTPIDSKGPWLKVMAIVMVLVMVVGIGYYLYDSGTLSDLGLDLDDPSSGFLGTGSGGGQTEEERIMSQYSPLEIQEALESGELIYEDLPKEIQNMVDEPDEP